MGKVKNHSSDVRTKAQRSLVMQLVFVLLAFTLLAVCSGVIMASTLNRKLHESASITIDSTASSISQTLLEPEVTLDFIADAVEDMLRRGEGFGAIKEYMRRCSSQTFKDDIPLFNYYSVYGYFDVFEENADFDLNAFFDGGGWIPHEDFRPKERPYYAAAVAAGGSVIISDPYIDADSGTPVIAYARELSDDSGGHLGVICLDVPMDYIRELITTEHITHGGYGILWDKDMRLLVHPNEDLIGERLRESPNDIARFARPIVQGSDISLEKFVNHEGIKSILFGKLLDNGWYLGIAIPESYYYRDLYSMIAVISILSVLLAAGLIIILVRINEARERSERIAREKDEQKKKLEALAFKEQEANKLKTRFLANMSHEVRTPMNAILGIAEIQLQNENLPPEIEEALGQIYESGTLLLNIINDILDLSKIEAGKLEIASAKYDLPSLINDVVQLMRLRYDNKLIEFVLEVDDNLPLNLFGDEIRIKQILNNILSNAFKYTDKGGVRLSVRSNPIGENETYLTFTVEDTGRGMTEEQVGKLFTEYTRFIAEENSTKSGTGLGLSITKHLVDLMGGDISVESTPGKGSVFTVRLPQKRANLLVCGSELAERLRSFHYQSVTMLKSNRTVREQIPNGRVLIVDDVASNIYVAKGMLMPYGLRIDTAVSGIEAIAKIRSGNEYDIVFMDHMMPRMNGMEATKTLREMGYEGCIVALTANALVGQAERFLANGFDGYISKPIDSRELDAVIQEFISAKKLKTAG